MQYLARVAGTQGQINPHSLRHTSTTTAPKTGISLHVLQDNMSHTGSRTTHRYDRVRNNPARTLA